MERNGNFITRQSTSVRVVDIGTTSVERENSNTRKTNFNYIHGCFKQRMECNAQRYHHTWKLESSGTSSSYQSLGTEGNFLCSTYLQKDSESNCSHLNRQYDLCGVHKPPRRYNISQFIKDHRGTVEFMFRTKGSSSREIHPRVSEHNCRPNVLIEEGQERLDVPSDNIFPNSQDLGSFSNRSIHDQDEYTTPKVLFMDHGSVRRSHRRLSPRLEENTVVDQLSLDTDISYSSESHKRKSISNDSSSLLEVSTMVPTSNQSSSDTSDNSQRTGSVSTDLPTPTTTYTKPKVEDTRVQYIWAWYELKGFSEKSINLLVSTLDKNFTRTVSSNIRIWLS
jgi:hypothetical protein